MPNIKDTQTNLQKSKSVINKPNNHVFNTIPDSTSKTLADKSQKIVTAVYMVTGLFSGTEELSNSIRQSSLLLMEALFENMILEGDKMSLRTAQYSLYEMISYIDVAYRTNLISDMNYSILIKEANNLQNEVINELNYNTSGLGVSEEKVIKLSDLFSNNQPSVENKNKEILKDIPEKKKLEEIFVAEMQIQNKEQIKSKIETKSNVPYIKEQKATRKLASYKRHEDIIKIMEQKKNASINDICALIKNCSSKTIQRDLNGLIKKGLVMKRGDRRWSVYNLR